MIYPDSLRMIVEETELVVSVSERLEDTAGLEDRGRRLWAKMKGSFLKLEMSRKIELPQVLQEAALLAQIPEP